MPNTTVEITGIKFPNPFILASGPPTRDYEMIARALQAGWGGAVTNTITYKPPAGHPRPRMALVKSAEGDVGMINLEVGSCYEPKQWQEWLKKLKKHFPERPLIASIGAPPDRDAWLSLAAMMVDAEIDALEINLSLPHGLPNRGLGTLIGQDRSLTARVVEWVNSICQMPLWVKLVPDVTDINTIAEAAAEAGADAFVAMNPPLGFAGVNIQRQRLLPSYVGPAPSGFYLGPGTKAIIMRHIAELSRSTTRRPVIGCSGVCTAKDAVEYMLLGARIVQVCNQVMMKGIGVIRGFKRDLHSYMSMHNFTTPDEFIGALAPFYCDLDQVDVMDDVVAIVTNKCISCGQCVIACKDAGYQAIQQGPTGFAKVSPDKCDGCGLCSLVCPADAIVYERKSSKFFPG